MFHSSYRDLPVRTGKKALARSACAGAAQPQSTLDAAALLGLEPEFRAAAWPDLNQVDSRREVAPEGLVQPIVGSGRDLELEGTERHISRGVAVIEDFENLLGSDNGAAGIRHIGVQGDRDDGSLHLSTDSGGRLHRGRGGESGGCRRQRGGRRGGGGRGVADGKGSVAGAGGSITPQAIDAARRSNPPAATLRPIGDGPRRENKARGRRTPSPARLVEGILAALRGGRGSFREGGPWTLEAKDGAPGGLIVPVARATRTAACAAGTAARTLFPGAGHVDGHRSAAHVLSVDHADRLLRVSLGFHLDKGETPGAACIAVTHHRDGLDRPGAGEHGLQLFLGGGVRQITYVQLRFHV